MLILKAMIAQHVMEKALLQQEITENLGLLDIASEFLFHHPRAGLLTNEAALILAKAIGPVLDLHAVPQTSGEKFQLLAIGALPNGLALSAHSRSFNVVISPG